MVRGRNREPSDEPPLPHGHAVDASLVLDVQRRRELLVAVGYLSFGRSFDGSGDAIPTAIGLIVAVSAIGWTLYSVYAG